GERHLLDSELALLDSLQQRIAESDRTVHDLSKRDPRVRRVRTIPGMGRFFSVLVVHEIGAIRRFVTPEKLCAYAGLGPSVAASGGTGPAPHFRVLADDWTAYSCPGVSLDEDGSRSLRPRPTCSPSSPAGITTPSHRPK